MKTIAILLFDFQDALLGLRRRWVRSLLGTLGIAIGVASLVAMLSISEGARLTALKKYETLGIATVRLEKKNASVDGKDSRNLLGWGELSRLQSALEDGSLLAYFYRVNQVPVNFKGRVGEVDVFYVNDDWFEVEQLELSTGRFISMLDRVNNRAHCVVGNAVARDLRLPVSSATLNVGAMSCTAVGILKKKGRLVAEGSGISSIDFDRAVYLPVSAYRVYESGQHTVGFDGINIRMDSQDEQVIRSRADRLIQFLTQWVPGSSGYRIIVPVKLLEQAKKTQRLFAMVMGAIAGMSLLVGGIGIMNVMLAHIAEQTREIGLRMSVGAEPWRVASLFIAHSVVLCLLGSLLGVMMGLLFGVGVQWFARWDVVFSFNALSLGPLFSLLTGLVFGLYPAVRASQLDPAIMLKEV